MLIKCTNCGWFTVEFDEDADLQPDGTPIQPCPNCDYPTLEIVSDVT